MGDTTNISWTDHSFNPWIGCLEVSEGCDHCYARVQSERYGRYVWGPPRSTNRMVTSLAYWRRPERWNARAANNDTSWDKNWQPAVRGGQRRLVFCASLSDVFEFHPQLDLIRPKLWTLIEATPWLDWQLLTKRPMNIRKMLPPEWLVRPRPNVWLGTSVEHQKAAELRIPHLLEVPAVVHFLSAEPLIGPLDLAEWLGQVDWTITGGESGVHHRPLNVKWVEDIDAQCRSVGVAHFFKQHGGRTHAAGGCLLHGVEVKEFPTPRIELAA